MSADFITLTPENLPSEHLSCIIRSRKPHPGIEAKRQWLADRMPEGHVFRKLNEKSTAFIEYAPLETAWVPVTGENYLYIYCLWVDGACKGKGYGKELMESCIADAKEKGRSGICMLGAKKQKHWLADQAFAGKFGFQIVETTAGGYELLALSFDGTVPAFAPAARKETIDSEELTIYYDLQCPFIPQYMQAAKAYCDAHAVPLHLICVDSLRKAKELPCPFNNCAVFYRGRLETVNLPDEAYLARLLKKKE